MAKIIAIDCDEVLADSMRSVLRYYDNDCCGSPIVREDITNYHLGEMESINATDEETVERFNHVINTAHGDVAPVSGAIEKTRERKAQGHKLYVVTARDEESIGPATRAWIDDHFGSVFEDVIFTNHFGANKKCKGDVCREIGADVFIDDSPFHAKAVAQYAVQTFLMDKPRNYDHNIMDHDHVTKVYDWSEIVID